MTELNQLYSCEICGNVVKVVHTGFGQLVCCGKNMTLKEVEKDSASEKEINDPDAETNLETEK